MLRHTTNRAPEQAAKSELVVERSNGHALAKPQAPEPPGDFPAEWPPHDPRAWAAAFCAMYPAIPRGEAMIWFAGALMRGFEAGEKAMDSLEEAPPDLAGIAIVRMAARMADDAEYMAQEIERQGATLSGPEALRLFAATTRTVILKFMEPRCDALGTD